MAIYHLHASTGNRGHDGTGRRGKNKKPKAGQSAKAKHDYICRDGKYTRNPDEVLFSESGNMPEWAAEKPGSYWDAADLYERKNGRLFKEVEFALPIELTLEQQIDTIRAFAAHLAGADNLPFTYAIHEGKGRNPHCHLMLNERINDGHDRTPETWFKRAANKGKPASKGGARKSERLKPADWLDNTRAAWSQFANDALERYGHDQRIDHRTLAAQRIDRLPQVHIGPNVAAMAERGILTDRSENFEAVNEYNQLRTEEAELELEIAFAVEALGAESREERAAAASDALAIQPPVAATQPYVPDDPEPSADDELMLARESQRRDVEDHIGRKHWLQIRAELRALESTQQRLYDEREAAEWDEWISRPDVDPVSGRIITEWAVDACIERERALPENQPPPLPERRVVPWPPEHDSELDMLKRAAAKQAAQAFPKPSPTAVKPSPAPEQRELKEAPQSAPKRALEPKETKLEPIPQAPQEAAFDAKKRVLEIICMETPEERAGAFLKASSLDFDEHDALVEELMKFEDPVTGELTAEGEKLRAKLLPPENPRVQIVEGTQNDQAWKQRSGPDWPGF